MKERPVWNRETMSVRDYQQALVAFLRADLPRHAFAPSLSLVALLERLAESEQKLADMTSDYHRWHDAFMDLKYPGTGQRVATAEAAEQPPAGWDQDFASFERLARSNAGTEASITGSPSDGAQTETKGVKWNYGCGADDCKHPTYDIFDANGGNIAREVSHGDAATICGMHGALQRVLQWEITDHEDDEKREYELCGLVNDIYILLNPDAPTTPPGSESADGAKPARATNAGAVMQGWQALTPSTENGYPDAVKQAAYQLDPECWVSYSGKPKKFKSYMETRRIASLKKASAAQGMK
jgi:hypothetical protein